MNKKVEHIGNQYTSQENKKKQRQKMKMRVVRRRIALFGGILLAIILILLVLLVIQRHNNDQDAVIALKEKLNNLNDKDYIEKIARDDYYLSNKGEVIFRLPDDKKSSQSKTSNEKGN